MKIAIIGASAGIGLQTTRLALEKEHEVITLSRRHVPLPDHAKLRRVQGSATNSNDVRAAVEGADSILVTLGTKSPLATTMFSDSARILLQTIREIGLLSNTHRAHWFRCRRQLGLQLDPHEGSLHAVSQESLCGQK